MRIRAALLMLLLAVTAAVALYTLDGIRPPAAAAARESGYHALSGRDGEAERHVFAPRYILSASSQNSNIVYYTGNSTQLQHLV